MRHSIQSDVINSAAQNTHVKGHGKHFKPLVAAGSWEISGFTYGSRSKCACCGRPICHVLRLKNLSHDIVSRDPAYTFPETIEIGIVCGPKVFTESCIGFYDDPQREWERQHRAWKEFITYTVLCVKNDDLWKQVPEQLRRSFDEYLSKPDQSQEHSGSWWMARDAKKKFLKVRRGAGKMPEPRVMYAASRSLIYVAKRHGFVSTDAELHCDWNSGKLTLT